jgi:ABC-type multidrug transport system fused ATPase/permease subunit
VAAERIFEVLEWKAEPDQTLLLPDSAQDPAQNKIKFKGKIEFKNVWFSYDLAGVSQEASEVASQEVTEPRYVLKDFNLTIEPGQSIGIVGHTGAGKSTIIQLLMRFFEPQRGEILIDGQSILSYPLQPYRRAVGVIQQDVFLFAGTIEDNIELWEKHATPVAAHSQIQTSTLNSKSLDERGSNLSMGERQMVAFERTFYHEPSIVILDEATAHIDSDTESRIQDSIQAQMKSEIHQRTFITIAHRLASVQNCDFIIVLHKGVMIEKGRHQELLELKGYYHKLHLVQSQESAI